MKTATSIIIALVIAVAVLGWLYNNAIKDRDAAQNDLSKLELIRSTQVDFLKSFAVEVHAELAKNDAKIIDTVSYFQAIVVKISKRDSKTRSQINPVNVVMAADTAEHRRQLLLRDTALANCDSTTSTLYAQIKATGRLQEKKDSLHAKLQKKAETAVSDLAEAAYLNSQRADRSERRANNPWGISGYAGYGATLAGGKVFMGPQAGVGVTYTIKLRKRK